MVKVDLCSLSNTPYRNTQKWLTLRTIICLGVAATQLYDGSFFYSSG
jgi:hypothetical protein